MSQERQFVVLQKGKHKIFKYSHPYLSRKSNIIFRKMKK